jgi:hypothetical protein
VRAPELIERYLEIAVVRRGVRLIEQPLGLLPRIGRISLGPSRARAMRDPQKGQCDQDARYCQPYASHTHLGRRHQSNGKVQGRELVTWKNGPRSERSCLNETLVCGYVEGRLVEAAAHQVARHAEGCEDCRELIAWVERDRAAAFAETDRRLSGDGDADALLAAVRREQADLSGQLLGGKYRLVSRLGSGGMGVLYEALNTWTDRRVALKLLHPRYSSDPETIDRFRRDAKSVGRITHSSIVEILDLDQDPSCRRRRCRWRSSSTITWSSNSRRKVPMTRSA